MSNPENVILNKVQKFLSEFPDPVSKKTSRPSSKSHVDRDTVFDSSQDKTVRHDRQTIFSGKDFFGK